MSVKNYILTVALVAAVLIGFVAVWTMNAGPRSATTAPTAVGPSSAGQSTASTAPALPAVTIVPAQLNAQGIPARLATVALTRVITGTAALDEMTQLHGQGFDLLTGYVAHYGQEQAILWVAQVKDKNAALALADQMANKIGPDNAMFKGLQALDISGRTLYSAVGQGQQHFFFAANDKVVWLQAAPDIAADVLHSLWSVVK